MKKGFTLIELLVVIAIVSILSALVIMSIRRVGGISGKPLTQEEICNQFSYISIKDLPAYCFKYFVGSSTQPTL